MAYTPTGQSVPRPPEEQPPGRRSEWSKGPGVMLPFLCSGPGAGWGPRALSPSSAGISWVGVEARQSSAKRPDGQEAQAPWAAPHSFHAPIPSFTPVRDAFAPNPYAAVLTPVLVSVI